MTDLLKSQPILIASSADVVGAPIQVSNCQSLSVTVRVVASAATLAATVAIGGTNLDPFSEPAPTFPALLTGKVIAGGSTEVDFEPTTGVLTIANAPIGLSEVTIAFTEFPKWIRASYDYASGGGTVDLQVVLAAWSV